jgi:hypothetical protein
MQMTGAEFRSETYKLGHFEIQLRGQIRQYPMSGAVLIRTPAIQKPIQEIFNLPEGTVTITFPKQLSIESYQDLEDQLSLLLRRVKRQANKDDEAAN